jgi:ditrans,polycis-polyprenyl diphosphate synthase
MGSRQNISAIRKWLLSSPPAEWAINQVRELLIGALRQGPIPKHVAFVMDGNRRFARSNRIETVEGHNLGFEALARILEVCYKSGVTHVTIYAFSIENFKRSKYEVDALMEMAKIKLTQLSQHGELLDRYGASIRILGQRELVKPDVLEAIDRAVELTSRNGDAVLNVCFPYTSRDEITTAIRTTVEDFSKPIATSSDKVRKSPFKEERIANNIRSQHLSSPQPTHLDAPTPHSPSSSTTSLSSLSSQHETSSVSSSTTLHPEASPSDSPLIKPFSSSSPTYLSPELITPTTLSKHMFTAADPHLDLLVRTSGVERLSDFMLWQCHQDTQIVFMSVLWPEFDLWSFLPVLWEWQWRRRKEGVNGAGGQGAKRRRRTIAGAI